MFIAHFLLESLKSEYERIVGKPTAAFPNLILVAVNAILCLMFLLECHQVTLTLLIDLDDTLLDNSMDTFIPAYLGALGRQLAPYTDPSKLSPVMMAATENMFRNNHPDRSLKEVFDPDFYPALGIREDQVRVSLDFFYTNIFPTLSTFTQKRPEAVRLMETATQRGWQVAIATNPLFPLAAILHRLNWAGIPAGKYPYAIIPSYETFHFAKPNPAYFAELLGRFGWPRGPILMVGNDPEHDIYGAQLMGIPTFWISNGQPFPDDYAHPNGTGTLNDVIPWLDAAFDEDLLPDYASPSAIMGTMRGIPSALLALVDNLPEKTWKHRFEAGAWSLTEVFCHLRDVEYEINLPRLQKIITEDTPFIPGVDSDVWAIERDYQSQNGLEALQDFVAVRIETLDILDSISTEDWGLPVQHAIFGPTSLLEIAGFIAGHDRLHIRQSYALIK
jgi:FMN phosphatase YigB (HAD superfamily)